ncbi:MAG: hypothetical protein HY430_00185 [Candidatus Levybacteria bacterium]|nr:hypothetical protein [Candidatus Levybacteria bacterium]
MQPPSLDPVINILKAKGYTDEQIGDTLAQLTKAAFMTMYQNAMSVFTEKDIATIDTCATDEEANQKIMEFYQLRTGNDAQADMNRFLEEFVKNFVSEHDVKTS